MKKKLLFVANVDWFFISHRLPVALGALEAGYEVHVATALTSSRSRLEDHGIIVHSLHIDRASTSVPGSIASFLQIWRVLRIVAPDVVHFVTIKPVLLGGLAARLSPVGSVVAAVSGLGFVFIARGIVASLRRIFVAQLYRLALGHHRNIAVIFQNPDDLRSVCHFARLSVDQVHLIRGAGVSLDEFRPTPLPQGPPVVVMASRLLVDKGVREFVAAAAIVRHEWGTKEEKPRFALVGEPDLNNRATISPEELEAIRRDGAVELWGYRQDMPSVLAASTIVVLPSYREGLPKVLIEASASGRPIVTTDVPGCRDAIAAGVTGILVPVRNPRALADAISKLAHNRELCEKMGAAATCYASEHFDVRRVVSEHLLIYDRLVRRSHAGSRHRG